MTGRTRALLLLFGFAAASCTSSARERMFLDGGAFVLPDSGFVWDGGTAAPDADVTDTGPFVCPTGCGDAQVCACLETRPNRSCGCQVRQGYGAPCDPQVPESCKYPFRCLRAIKIDGTHFICSDGREGTACSRTEERPCNTDRGCLCMTTPLGTACSCQGPTGPNPLLCDPLVPSTCPEGTCVRVELQAGHFDICSDGSEHEPCNAGVSSCHTSLGCTCPLAGTRTVCRCSEPGTYEGYACDPRVDGSCAPPLACTVRGDPLGGFVSECEPAGGVGRDAGTDPSECNPNDPLTCPRDYSCQEVSPGRFRCRPGPL